MRLGEICKIKYGKDHKKLNDGNIPVYGSGGIMRYVDTALWSGPSVLIPRKGTLGNLFFVSTPFWTVDTLFYTDINTSEVIPKFLYYQLKTKNLTELNVGTAVPSLTTEVLNDIEIDLPSLEKQKQVVEVLGRIDAKIEVNSKLNGYLEELLLAQFKALVPTNDWSEGRAESFFEIGIGKTPPRKEPKWFSNVRKGNCVWLSIKDMAKSGAYSLDSMEYLTLDAVRQKNVRKVPEGSVLLSFKLTVGRVKIAACDMTTNEAIACFSSNDSRRLAYVYPYLLTYDYDKLGSTSSIATAVNSKTIKAMSIAMPDDKELDSFYELSKPLYGQMLCIAKENARLELLRDALLPKLMSGEIDVSKVDLTQLNSHLAERLFQS